jgi:carbon starvation protein
MHGARYMWITCVPLTWLVIVTFSAGYEKIFSDQPRLGFLAEAAKIQAGLDAGTAANVAAARTQIFNAHLNAFMCAIFLVLVTTILIDSIRIWAAVLTGSREARVAETPFVLTRLQPEEL